MTTSDEAITARIARAVIDVRKARNLSGPALAERTGGVVSHATLANLESGRKRVVGIDEIIALARALDVPPIALLYPDPFAQEDDVLRFVGHPDGVSDNEDLRYASFWDYHTHLRNAWSHEDAGNVEAAAEARRTAALARAYGRSLNA